MSEFKVRITVDTKEFNAKVKELRGIISEKFKNIPVTLSFSSNTVAASLRRAVKSDIEESIRTFFNKKFRLNVDTSKLKNDVNSVRDLIARSFGNIKLRISSVTVKSLDATKAATSGIAIGIANAFDDKRVHSRMLRFANQLKKYVHSAIVEAIQLASKNKTIPVRITFSGRRGPFVGESAEPVAPVTGITRAGYDPIAGVKYQTARLFIRNLAYQFLGFMGFANVFYRAREFYSQGTIEWMNLAGRLRLLTEKAPGVGESKIFSEIASISERFGAESYAQVAELLSTALAQTRSLPESIRRVKFALDVQATGAADAASVIKALGKATAENERMMKQIANSLGIVVSEAMSMEQVVRAIHDKVAGSASRMDEANGILDDIIDTLKRIKIELGAAVVRIIEFVVSIAGLAPYFKAHGSAPLRQIIFQARRELEKSGVPPEEIKDPYKGLKPTEPGSAGWWASIAAHFAGGAVGAMGGAKLGALIGAPFGPIGAAVGGTLGAIAGGIAASSAVSWTQKKLGYEVDAWQELAGALGGGVSRGIAKGIGAAVIRTPAIELAAGGGRVTGFVVSNYGRLVATGIAAGEAYGMLEEQMDFQRRFYEFEAQYKSRTGKELFPQETYAPPTIAGPSTQVINLFVPNTPARGAVLAR